MGLFSAQQISSPWRSRSSGPTLSNALHLHHPWERTWHWRGNTENALENVRSHSFNEQLTYLAKLIRRRGGAEDAVALSKLNTLPLCFVANSPFNYPSACNSMKLFAPSLNLLHKAFRQTFEYTRSTISSHLVITAHSRRRDQICRGSESLSLSLKSYWQQIKNDETLPIINNQSTQKRGKTKNKMEGPMSKKTKEPPKKANHKKVTTHPSNPLHLLSISSNFTYPLRKRKVNTLAP
jgi:hypothetical protein